MLDAAPYLSKHDDLDWHLHVTEPEKASPGRPDRRAGRHRVPRPDPATKWAAGAVWGGRRDDVYLHLSATPPGALQRHLPGTAPTRAAYRARRAPVLWPDLPGEGDEIAEQLLAVDVQPRAVNHGGRCGVRARSPHALLGLQCPDRLRQIDDPIRSSVGQDVEAPTGPRGSVPLGHRRHRRSAVPVAPRRAPVRPGLRSRGAAVPWSASVIEFHQDLDVVELHR